MQENVQTHILTEPTAGNLRKILELYPIDTRVYMLTGVFVPGLPFEITEIHEMPLPNKLVGVREVCLVLM